MIKKIFIYIFILFALAACNNNGGNGSEIPDSVGLEQVGSIDPSAINKIIESFSSPIEMAAMIEDMDVPYSAKYLVPTENVDDYDSNFKKAVGLGMLSSDLGYLNVYQKTNSIVEYLTGIRRLADDLDIDQFFDFQTLKRLATNSEDLDSLMFLSVNSYHRMDDHLRKTQRSDLSALMVTGVWLEGIYLACQVNRLGGNEELRERIGEQKNILSDLLIILRFFKNKTHFKEAIQDFEELKAAYEDVKITVKIGESKSEVDEHGQLVIIPAEYTVVEMTDDQLKEIIRLIEKSRNRLIK